MLHINNFIFAIFCIMREEKGMDITMNKLVDLKIILVLLIFAGVLTFRTDSAHADDAIRLTEEEVKREIEDYIKKEQKEEASMFTPHEYDMEELCELNEMFFMINDYIEGKDLKTIIKGTELSGGSQEEEQVKEKHNVRKWYLPFKNMSGKTGYLIFEEKNEEIEWSKSSIETSQYYDMKVREGKYEGIILDEVEEEIYCNSAAYGFKFAYIKMKDGREYVIPFISENVSEWNSLVCKKIYTVQEFFTIMYRYYDEPTLEELIEQSETMDNTTTGISYFREVPLGKDTVLPGSPSKRTELTEKNIFKVAAGGATGIGIICFIIRKKRKSY